jgi:hypothetical protein
VGEMRKSAMAFFESTCTSLYACWTGRMTINKTVLTERCIYYPVRRTILF